MPTDSSHRRIRLAARNDAETIHRIHSQGIEDRSATLDEEPRTTAEMDAWLDGHDERFAILVAERDEAVVGWASLNRFSPRHAYRFVADLSVYVERSARGSGVGSALLGAVERHARAHDFHKIVLMALASNEAGSRLYASAGYRLVGTFAEQGLLDGRFVDVVAMEKILAD